LATIYGHLNRPAEEAAAWERFVASSPNPNEACPGIGNAYRRAGHIDKAIDAFARCLSFDPQSAEMQFYAGHAAEWKHDWALAKRLYQSSAAIDPKNIDVRLGLGRVALHEQRFDAARASADSVLNEQDDADAALLGGIAAFRSGHMRDARAYLDRGLRRSPNYADLHFYLGLIDEREGQPQAANQHFARAAALEPSRPEFTARAARAGGGR
jgi:tetratricopeptide (TPR) repeat protein